MTGTGLVLFSLAVAGVSAMYSPSDDVVDLTPTNFHSKVINGDELWIVEFYAPWCGHCQSLAPEWKKAASALKHHVVKIDRNLSADVCALGDRNWSVVTWSHSGHFALGSLDWVSLLYKDEVVATQRLAVDSGGQSHSGPLSI